MPPRQPPARSLPHIWLFTDARIDGALLSALAACPPRSGVVVRHDHLAKGARAALLRRVRRAAKARRMTLMLAGTGAQAGRLGADGVHLRRTTRAAVKVAHARGLAVSAPVHNRLQLVAARRAGVDLVFASPVFTTRSHAGAAALGVKAYLRLTVGCGMAAVPLGGMTARRARGICRRRGGGPAGAPAFAAIDHWVDQARKRRG